MSNLKNKKILYIGVSTFGYEKEIQKALEKKGAEVDYYDERPANTFWTKVFLRLGLKSFIRSKINAHYSNILTRSQEIDYDYVFVIKLETIDQKILEQLKSNQPNATFILYLWDSINNYKGREKLFPYFDKAFSFDKNDVAKYSHLNFLPLFYIPLYERQEDKKTEIKYDMCFFGTGHSDRYHVVKEIERLSKEMDIKFYSFLYLQSKIIFWVKKLFDTSMKSAKVDDFSFESLSQNQILNIIKQSNSILDIEHRGQVGLTMRTIEALGAQKKLITTNQNIKEYDFYHENNILIIDRKNVTLDKSFFTTRYKEINPLIYKKYSLENWLKTIFINNEEN